LSYTCFSAVSAACCPVSLHSSASREPCGMYEAVVFAHARAHINRTVCAMQHTLAAASTWWLTTTAARFS
jgi:hypothetical protein